MALDVVTRSFSLGGSSAINRFFIDMPLVAGKICMIRQVHFLLVDWARTADYDITFGVSVDPDAVPASMIAADSRMFVLGRWALRQSTAVGFQVGEILPRQFFFPEGIKCPYTRLPAFVQHSNTNANVSNYRVAIFFEFLKISAQDLAVAVLRRGRGATRD